MQVARLLDNQYRRTPTVKLRQIVRAIQLESSLSKKQILRLYLGLAPFGGRVKGVRAASLKFFGKEPHQLSVGEAALLVALPQAPEARRPDRDAAAALRARNFVLKTVAAAGVLTPAEAELASREPLIVEAPPMPEIPTPKPAATNVAGLFAGLTLGLNVIVATPATAAPMQPPPNYFLGSDEQVALDVERCVLDTPVSDDLNVAALLPPLSDGHCMASGCWIPLDASAFSGWFPVESGNRVQLPEGLCERVRAGTASVRISILTPPFVAQ